MEFVVEGVHELPVAVLTRRDRVVVPAHCLTVPEVLVAQPLGNVFPVREEHAWADAQAIATLNGAASAQPTGSSRAAWLEMHSSIKSRCSRVQEIVRRKPSSIGTLASNPSARCAFSVLPKRMTEWSQGRRGPISRSDMLPLSSTTSSASRRMVVSVPLARL